MCRGEPSAQSPGPCRRSPEHAPAVPQAASTLAVLCVPGGSMDERLASATDSSHRIDTGTGGRHDAPATHHGVRKRMSTACCAAWPPVAYVRSVVRSPRLEDRGRAVVGRQLAGPADPVGASRVSWRQARAARWRTASSAGSRREATSAAPDQERPRGGGWLMGRGRLALHSGVLKARLDRSAGTAGRCPRAVRAAERPGGNSRVFQGENRGSVGDLDVTDPLDRGDADPGRHDQPQLLRDRAAGVRRSSRTRGSRRRAPSRRAAGVAPCPRFIPSAVT